MNTLFEAVKKIIKQRKKLKTEATTTGDVAGYQTPYAFSTRKLGNIDAANQLGYKVVDRYSKLDEKSKPAKKSKKTSKKTKKNKLDTNKDGKINAQDAVNHARSAAIAKNEKDKTSYKIAKSKQKAVNKMIKEGIKSSIYSNKNEQQTVKSVSPELEQNPEKSFSKSPIKKVAPELEQSTSKGEINVQNKFLNFQKKLNDCSEELKDKLQVALLKELLGKKVTARSSKGQGQSISDYTFTVIGIDIDYYNNKYFIVITGKEDGKESATRFLLQPFYKIRSFGLSKNLKPSDLETIRRYKEIIDSVEPSDTNIPTDKQNITRDEIPAEPKEKIIKPDTDVQKPNPDKIEKQQSKVMPR